MIGFGCETATIFYRKATFSETECDPITGLPIETFSETLECFRVSIEKDGSESAINPVGGKDITKHFYSGRFNGDSLPTWYQPGGEYEIELDAGFKGTWYAYGTNIGRLNLTSIFGISIEGAIIY